MSSSPSRLALVTSPAPSAPSNVTPLRPPAEPEHDARVVVELLEDAAAAVLVINGKSFRVATLTGGPPNRPEVLLRAAQRAGELIMADVLSEADHG